MAPVQDADAILALGEYRESQQFAQFIAPELLIAEATNLLRPDALNEVLTLMMKHPKMERLLTAARHYALAVRHWRPGYEMAAVSSLFAGMETLKPLVVANERVRSGNVTREELAKRWSVEVRNLESEARRRILFRGDDRTHEDAATARHGYVHGFKTFEAVGPLAASCRDRTAAYLRSGIFELLGVSQTTTDDLTQKRLSPPVPGNFGGITGTLENPLTVDDAIELDFRLLVEVDRRPTAVSLDAQSGKYAIEMTSNTKIRIDGVAVSGALYTPGTNITSPPAVTAVERKSADDNPNST